MRHCSFYYKNLNGKDYLEKTISKPTPNPIIPLFLYSLPLFTIYICICHIEAELANKHII